MGVVNVTPDSFSDGGRWLDPEAAIAHGLALRRATAPTSSTSAASRPGPGAGRVDADEELRRVAARSSRRSPPPGVVVSVDTMRAEVADAALAAGAVARQRRQRRPRRPGDGRGSSRDARVPYVAMHWRGAQRPDGASSRVYDDVVADVRDELARAARRRWSPPASTPDRIVLDPGLGFAKHGRAQLGAAARTSTRSLALGRPLLVGASRKRFLGRRCWPRPTGDAGRSPERDAATAATTRAGRGGRRLVRAGARRRGHPPTPSAWSRQSLRRAPARAPA